MAKLMMLPAIGVWPMLEYELDIAERHLAAGQEVVFLVCEGNAPFCPANLAMKKRICSECQSRVRSGINWLGRNRPNLTIGSLYNISKTEQVMSRRLAQEAGQGRTTDLNDLPADLRGTDWYEAAYSTLQTTFKELRPDLAARRQLFENILEDYFQAYFSFHANCRQHQPDTVWIYNGRITRYRPALRAAQKSHLRVYTYEYPLHGFKRYVVFEGQYLHDFGFRSRVWKERFEKYPLPENKKLDIGDRWFRKRLHRVQLGYEKVFASLQVKDLLPEDWNGDRCNIAVFNSSEWESAGVPESKRWAYEDQYSALERIFRDTENLSNIHFTFRIHPHLAKRDPHSVTRFMTLSRFSHVTVLPPSSKYDTYALVMASDLTLTFYSLVGVEAAYLGKPVICIGPTPYQDFGCAYLPRTHAELIDALTHREEARDRFPLVEKARYGAKAFAFARTFSGEKVKYVVKRNYYRALMRRNGVLTEIRAGIWIKILNRMLSLPHYLLETVQRIRKDEMLRHEISRSPVSAVARFIRERIFGTVP